MIYHPVAQQSPEWFKMRLGVATSSCFSNIVTPAKGEFSKSAEAYADQLIGEMVTGESAEKFQSYWMERGAIMEADAAASYEFLTGFTLDRGGFITNDDMTIGASPDRRVLPSAGGDAIGAAEIKCPSPAVHIANLLRSSAIDPAHKPQVQGQILIGEFSFVDWFSYHPQFPPAYIRTYRDDEYCDKLQDALNKFMDILNDKMTRLTAMGLIIPERPIFDIHAKMNDAIPDNFMAG